MRWLICPDSFKDAATATEICEAIARGMRFAEPGVSIATVPLSDGGEGFIDMGEALGWGLRISVDVCDALQRPLKASYLYNADLAKAWIGIAEASGIQELKPGERDGRITTSLGSGRLIADALDRGAHTLVIGLGGSAVNDGGCGMAKALGYRFYDKKGDPFLPTGKDLDQIDRIEPGPRDLSTPDVTVLSDVQHVLAGPEGATFNFGPQKGIPPEALAHIDAGMAHLARVWKRDLHRDVANTPGAGAAGGMGGGCMAFLHARPASGTQMTIEWTGLERAVMMADAVVTGEGKLDETSFRGKLISGVLDLCRRHDTPCYIVCGINQLKEERWKDLGIGDIWAICEQYDSEDQAMEATLESCEDFGKERMSRKYD